MTQPAPRTTKPPPRAMTPGEMDAAVNVATIINGPDVRSYGADGLLVQAADSVRRLNREARRARAGWALLAVAHAVLRGDGCDVLAIVLSDIRGVRVTPDQAAKEMDKFRADPRVPGDVTSRYTPASPEATATPSS